MKPLKFLIIDDDPYNNIICRELIRMTISSPCQVVDMTSAEEGLAYIAEQPPLPEAGDPTLIFLDINMPTMSGWEFLAHFDRLEDAVKRRYAIYILSSSVDPRDREQAAINPNVRDYIIKPVPEEFLIALDNSATPHRATGS